MIMSEGNVTLRSAIKKDVSLLVDWWSKGEVMAHAGFPNGLKTDPTKLLKRIEIDSNETHPRKGLLIISIENNKPIGEMNYRETYNDVYEIGIKICEISEQGKGYGEKAMRMLIEYITSSLYGKKIALDTNLKNIGAQNFYSRLGFTKTGVRKDCFRDQLGVLQSAVDFELDLISTQEFS